MIETITLRIGEPVMIGGITATLSSIGEGYAIVSVGEEEPKRTFRKTFKRPVNATAVDEHCVIELAKEWCRTICRITVLNQVRASALFARMKDGYRLDACLDAIREYGEDEWHRKNNRWLDIGDFFSPQNLERWIRLAEDRKDKAAKAANSKARIANPELNRVVSEVANARREKTADEKFSEILAGKTKEEIEALQKQAITELHGMYPTRKIFNSFSIDKQIRVILERK